MENIIVHVPKTLHQPIIIFVQSRHRQTPGKTHLFILHHLQSNDIRTTSQWVFLEGKSTVTALIKIDTRMIG